MSSDELSSLFAQLNPDDGTFSQAAGGGSRQPSLLLIDHLVTRLSRCVGVKSIAEGLSERTKILFVLV